MDGGEKKKWGNRQKDDQVLDQKETKRKKMLGQLMVLIQQFTFLYIKRVAESLMALMRLPNSFWFPKETSKKSGTVLLKLMPLDLIYIKGSSGWIHGKQHYFIELLFLLALSFYISALTGKQNCFLQSVKSLFFMSWSVIVCSSKPLTFSSSITTKCT